MAGLSVRYATALFELAMESGTLDESFTQAVFLRDTLQDADCQRIISHPHISASEKIAFFNNAFAGSTHENLLGLIFLAIKKDRESYLVPALDDFIEMVNKHKLKTTAQVTSAVTLSDGQISALKAALSQKLNKQVDVVPKVDPDVIGGFTVFVDGYLIDRTLKKQFHDLKKTLSVAY
jgi:F-type H+-transporting ATPase subunit delta